MFGFLKDLFTNKLLEEVKTRYGLRYDTHPSSVISGSAMPKAWLCANDPTFGDKIEESVGSNMSGPILNGL